MRKLKTRSAKQSPKEEVVDVRSSDSEQEDVNEKLKEEEEEDESVKNSIPPSSKIQKKVLLAHKQIVSKGWDNIESFNINHPKTGNKAIFLLDNRLSEYGDESFYVFEMLTLSQPTRSWFVDDSVITDGNWYVSTPIDPLFLLIPVLEKSSRAMPFKDHLYDNLPSKVIDILTKRVCSSQLERIAIKKVCGDIEAYLYSEEKCISWLTKKVMKVADFLKKRNINSCESSISSNFSKSTLAENEFDEKDGLRYASDIVGEYLTEALKKKLLTSLGLPAEPERSKRKNNDSAAETGQNKKLKVTDNVQPLEDYGSSLSANAGTANKNSKGTAKVKELQKAAQGTASLFKFFTPRSK